MSATNCFLRRLTNMKLLIEVVDIQTRTVIETVDVTGKSEKEIKATEIEVKLRLDMERYFTRINNCEIVH